MFCPNCGGRNEDGGRFCKFCGADLTSLGSSQYQGPGEVPNVPAPGYGPPGYGPPPYGQPGYPPQGYGPAVNSGKATASFILGIVGIFILPVICSLLAIVLGVTARNEIDASRGTMGGMAAAVAGIVLGIIGLVGWIIMLVVIFGIS